MGVRSIYSIHRKMQAQEWPSSSCRRAAYAWSVASVPECLGALRHRPTGSGRICRGGRWNTSHPQGQRLTAPVHTDVTDRRGAPRGADPQTADARAREWHPPVADTGPTRRVACRVNAQLPAQDRQGVRRLLAPHDGTAGGAESDRECSRAWYRAVCDRVYVAHAQGRG